MYMTDAAMTAIEELYAELRQEADNLSLPITVRSLETIIRLSTAAAIARMSATGVEQVKCCACIVCVLVSQLTLLYDQIPCSHSRIFNADVDDCITWPNELQSL